jgi:hypothetical protein
MVGDLFQAYERDCTAVWRVGYGIERASYDETKGRPSYDESG